MKIKILDPQLCSCHYLTTISDGRVKKMKKFTYLRHVYRFQIWHPDWPEFIPRPWYADALHFRLRVVSECMNQAQKTLRCYNLQSASCVHPKNPPEWQSIPTGSFQEPGTKDSYIPRVLQELWQADFEENGSSARVGSLYSWITTDGARSSFGTMYVRYALSTRIIIIRIPPRRDLDFGYAPTSPKYGLIWNQNTAIFLGCFLNLLLKCAWWAMDAENPKTKSRWELHGHSKCGLLLLSSWMWLSDRIDFEKVGV